MPALRVPSPPLFNFACQHNPPRASILCPPSTYRLLTLVSACQICFLPPSASCLILLSLFLITLFFRLLLVTTNCFSFPSSPNISHLFSTLLSFFPPFISCLILFFCFSSCSSSASIRKKLLFLFILHYILSLLFVSFHIASLFSSLSFLSHYVSLSFLTRSLCLLSIITL